MLPFLLTFETSSWLERPTQPIALLDKRQPLFWDILLGISAGRIFFGLNKQ